MLPEALIAPNPFKRAIQKQSLPMIIATDVKRFLSLGATNGYPSDPTSVDSGLVQTNGLGNLIIGYNELGNPFGDDRTGSHNVVFGQDNSYESFGGLVGSLNNTIAAPFASTRVVQRIE